MHAELATPPALPPCVPSPLAPFGQHDGPAIWRRLRPSHLLLSGHCRSRGSKSSAQPCLPRRSQPTGLTAGLSSASRWCDDWRHSSVGSPRTSVWSVARPTAETIASRRAV